MPVQVVPSLLHFVTQWMSTVNVSGPSTSISSQVQETGSSPRPSIVSVQPAVLVRGVGPAESTGKSGTTDCPGGTRPSSEGLRGRPLKPREIGDIGRAYPAGGGGGPGGSACGPSARRGCSRSRSSSGSYSLSARRRRATTTPVAATPATPASPSSFHVLGRIAA